LQFGTKSEERKEMEPPPSRQTFRPTGSLRTSETAAQVHKERRIRNSTKGARESTVSSDVHAVAVADAGAWQPGNTGGAQGSTRGSLRSPAREAHPLGREPRLLQLSAR